MHRERDELNAIIQAWKDDYVFLLQSCITASSADVTDSWHVRLHGGDTVSYFPTLTKFKKFTGNNNIYYW